MQNIATDNDCLINMCICVCELQLQLQLDLSEECPACGLKSGRIVKKLTYKEGTYFAVEENSQSTD